MICSVRIIASVATLIVVQAAATEEFVWKYGGRLIGHLHVPTSFTVETYNYREGIVTTLRYVDGAYIVLQVGFMYRIPLFQDKDHKLISSTEQATKTIRVGQFADAGLCWREDDFKPTKTSGKTVSLMALFPPNVGYGKVPPARRDEFDRALDSFVRELGPPTSRGR